MTDEQHREDIAKTEDEALLLQRFRKLSKERQQQLLELAKDEKAIPNKSRRAAFGAMGRG